MDRIAVQDLRENVGNRHTEPDFVIRIMNGGKNMSALGGILNPEESNGPCRVSTSIL